MVGRVGGTVMVDLLLLVVVVVVGLVVGVVGCLRVGESGRAEGKTRTLDDDGDGGGTLDKIEPRGGVGGGGHMPRADFAVATLSEEGPWDGVIYGRRIPVTAPGEGVEREDTREGRVTGSRPTALVAAETPDHDVAVGVTGDEMAGVGGEGEALDVFAMTAEHCIGTGRGWRGGGGCRRGGSRGGPARRHTLAGRRRSFFLHPPSDDAGVGFRDILSLYRQDRARTWY